MYWVLWDWICFYFSCFPSRATEIWEAVNIACVWSTLASLAALIEITARSLCSGNCWSTSLLSCPFWGCFAFWLGPGHAPRWPWRELRNPPLASARSSSRCTGLRLRVSHAPAITFADGDATLGLWECDLSWCRGCWRLALRSLLAGPGWLRSRVGAGRGQSPDATLDDTSWGTNLLSFLKRPFELVFFSYKASTKMSLIQ